MRPPEMVCDGSQTPREEVISSRWTCWPTGDWVMRNSLAAGSACAEHLERVMARLSPEIAATQACVEISEPLPDLWANPNVLEQVLTNLLTNALKFVPKGARPQVRIRAEDAGACCRILVQDNGIGVPPEHQQSIFGVFQRLHAPEEYPGTGIGLAIVQKSIERLGGKVGVDSTPGHGSCFWFELPKA